MYFVASLAFVFSKCYAEIANQVRPFVEGKAYDMKSGEFLYSEMHDYTSEKQHVVVYYEANGKEFARKTLIYNGTLFAPGFVQENIRTGERIEVNKEGLEKYILKYKKNSRSETKKSILYYQEPFVVDAGFDKYIRLEWRNLRRHGGQYSITCCRQEGSP